MSIWEESTLFLNTQKGITEQDGIVKNGLAIFKLCRGYYRLMHLNTGLAIIDMKGTLPYAKGIGERVLLMCETWDFVGIDGWKNITPDLVGKIVALMNEEYPKVLKPKTYKDEGMRDQAAHIAQKRGA